MERRQAKLILCRGLPASGKSTWSKDYLAANPETVRINNDDLADMLRTGGFGADAKLLQSTTALLLADFMSKGLDIIIDNTNLTDTRVNYYNDLVEKFNAENTELSYTIVIKDFTDVPYQSCIIRNAKRDRHVPEKVIYAMHLKHIADKTVPLVQDANLPLAIVCDIDGTIARNVSRSVYDSSKYAEDELIEDVWRVVNTIRLNYSMRNCHIFFITGRDEVGRRATETWLEDKCELVKEDYTLIMRKPGDSRPDFVYKEEAFNEHLKDKFYIVGWFEDRFRNVMMARVKLGLENVYQVGEGGF